MIMAVGIFVFMAICALSLVGLGESHIRVSKILNDLDDHREKRESQTKALPAIEPHAHKMDVFAEVAFTRSLLALSKVRSLDPYEVPILEPDESSSWASVRRVQS
jgi:hypothetical protein